MSNIPPLIDMSFYINMSINNNTQIVDDEPPPLTYMYEYKSYIMIDINMYKCKKCDKVLQTVTGIISHYHTHNRSINNEPNNEIVQLKKSGYSKTFSKTVDGRYACKTCDKILASRSGMLEHVHKHEQNHVLKYKCNICNHQVFNKSGIFRHVKIHLSHITMQDLDKYITKKDDVFRNTHNTIYKCKYCDYENRIQKNMFQHFKMTHSINVSYNTLKKHIE
jgi:hypothetical protein